MLIFLDIDGVMVPAKSWKKPELLNDGFPVFSNTATHVLQSLISEDTTVMLTTSHKSTYTVDQWKDIFSNRGIQVDNIQTIGDNTAHLSRKDEIVNWFNANPVKEGFVILDDDTSLYGLPDSLKKNLVVTGSMVGLTEEHLQKATDIIQEQLHLQVA